MFLLKDKRGVIYLLVKITRLGYIEVDDWLVGELKGFDVTLSPPSSLIKALMEVEGDNWSSNLGGVAEDNFSN